MQITANRDAPNAIRWERKINTLKVHETVHKGVPQKVSNQWPMGHNGRLLHSSIPSNHFQQQCIFQSHTRKNYISYWEYFHDLQICKSDNILLLGSPYCHSLEVQGTECHHTKWHRYHKHISDMEMASKYLDSYTPFPLACMPSLRFPL